MQIISHLPRLARPLTDNDVAIFVPKYNMPGTKDATGAFHRGAGLFCKHFGLTTSHIVHNIDNRAQFSDRAIELLYTLEVRCQATQKITKTQVDAYGRPSKVSATAFFYPRVYVFFCHGWVNGIQLGITAPTPKKPFNDTAEYNWNEFLRLLARVAPMESFYAIPITIILFACSTGDDPQGPDFAPGSGEGSFGDLLRDGLYKLGIVDARVVTHFTAGHSYLNPDIKIYDCADPTHEGARPLYSNIKEKKVLLKLLKEEGEFTWTFPFMNITTIQQKLGRSI